MENTLRLSYNNLPLIQSSTYILFRYFIGFIFINCYVHSKRLWEFFLVQILADKLGPYYVTLTIKLSIVDVTSLQNKAMFISYVAWPAPFRLLQIVSKVCEVTDQVTMIASWHFQVIYLFKYQKN